MTAWVFFSGGAFRMAIARSLVEMRPAARAALKKAGHAHPDRVASERKKVRPPRARKSSVQSASKSSAVASLVRNRWGPGIEFAELSTEYVTSSSHAAAVSPW